jgi:hypothetical protein
MHDNNRQSVDRTIHRLYDRLSSHVLDVDFDSPGLSRDDRRGLSGSGMPTGSILSGQLLVDVVGDGFL